MVIKNEHSNESFDTDTFSSEMMTNDELVVDIDGFEGPLDLLLTLSRSQKLDLMKISILELAEQYLEFVEKARTLKIELAADLVIPCSSLSDDVTNRSSPTN